MWGFLFLGDDIFFDISDIGMRDQKINSESKKEKKTWISG